MNERKLLYDISYYLNCHLLPTPARSWHRGDPSLGLPGRQAPHPSATAQTPSVGSYLESCFSYLSVFGFFWFFKRYYPDMESYHIRLPCPTRNFYVGIHVPKFDCIYSIDWHSTGLLSYQCTMESVCWVWLFRRYRECFKFGSTAAHSVHLSSYCNWPFLREHY